MKYYSLQDCIEDLEKNGHLIRIKEEVDPNLEMAAIHLRVFEKNGPAILFENIKGTKFKAVSNLFGNLDRSRFMFRKTIENVKKIVEIKADPSRLLKQPLRYLSVPFTGLKALPMKSWNNPVLENECKISDLPLIKHWPMDGGAFVTLPIVYTEDPEKPGVMNSNIGMYRIQLSGNNYELNKEIGLHYQLHRGIGVHQTKWNKLGKPMKVSIFIGGPPSHTFSAVMPLPEEISELTFAGALGGRRFRYTYKDGYCISADADFVICGEVYPGENKPEGPFGDHLGYYSLTHDFPLMKVHKVYHRTGAIWPFTVVGRPPQEDTQFGALIHEITGPAIPSEIPGLHEVHAVDAAGVHPLLLAIGSERYTPYYNDRKPQEILTIANHILGTGQLSLAKFLFIAAKEDNPNLNIHHPKEYFIHVLKRADWKRDLHFYTKTSIDTLDYSGETLNSGSKVVIACAGNEIRTLGKELPLNFVLPNSFKNPFYCFDGVLAIETNNYTTSRNAALEMEVLNETLKNQLDNLIEFPLIVICDNAEFVAKSIENFVWVTFTRCNPSHDIYGIESFTEHKHWGCKGPLIIDARKKPHHAPELIKDEAIETKINRLFEKGGSLSGLGI